MIPTNYTRTKTLLLHHTWQSHHERCVDFENLDDAVNTAMTRYSYFTIHVELNQDGDYVLSHNNERIVVKKKDSIVLKPFFAAIMPTILSMQTVLNVLPIGISLCLASLIACYYDLNRYRENKMETDMKKR